MKILKLRSTLMGVMVFLSTLSIDRVVAEAPNYQPAKIETSRLTSVGSDSMGGLVERWVDSYKAYQPQVTLQVVSYGSASAPPALIEGSAHLGHMARPMKESEVDDFQVKYGFAPTQVKTALAGVAIYVAESNPLREISFEQLDALFSASRKRGSNASIQLWKDLGVKGAFGEKPIALVGLADTDYSNVFFKQQVLLQGEFTDTVQFTTDTKSLIETIAQNPNAIGFGMVSQNAQGVRLLAVAHSKRDKAVQPNATTLVSGDYPLARYLSLYVVRHPTKPLDPALRDFLHFALSKQGQEIVRQQGLIPLTPSTLEAELRKVG